MNKHRSHSQHDVNGEVIQIELPVVLHTRVLEYNRRTLKLKLKLGDITIQLKQPKPAYTVELNPRCIQLEEHEQVNADTAGERLSLL